MARTFSFACFLGAAALSVRALVRRHGRRGWAFGALAVGCAAASTPVCEGFFDLVRDDTMALFLYVLCAVLVDGRRRLSRTRLGMMALVCTAVVYTRQPVVFFPVWVVLFVFARHRRSGWLLALLTTALSGLILVALQFTSHGWYWMQTVSLVQDHALIGKRFIAGADRVLHFAPFLAALPLVAIGLAVTRRLSPSGLLWTGMLAASIPASLLPSPKWAASPTTSVPVLFPCRPRGGVSRGRPSGGPEAAPAYRADARGASPRRWRGLPLRPHLGRRGHDPHPGHVWQRRFAQPAGCRVARRRSRSAPSIPAHPKRRHHASVERSMGYPPTRQTGHTSPGPRSGRLHRPEAVARYALVSGNETRTTARELSTRFQLEDVIPSSPGTLIGDSSSMRYLLRANDEERDGHLLFDFESLDGWTGATDAFSVTTSRPSWQQPIEGTVGKHIANRYTRERRDNALGTLTSPHFVIDRPHISLRIGGGFHAATRVELHVDGRTERSAVGIWEQKETLTRVVWDVHTLQGKDAQLVLVDDDMGFWGHLLCDHVVLY